MNQWDRDNLNYILSLTPQQLKDWYSELSDDDVQYAFELVALAMLELEEPVMDVSTAATLLKRFTLKGN